ncbi:DUF998 domain-containing protein [Micromonospora inyonensis]|uniref:DUF998 domain-containing protein n=1 Tax=Micromonospora inyonensis TaxID=47866 RepID=A0A1C6R8D3_9ACTN|nr:DUF998 domain-containing protein [Micromonospora inyonensis]SCL13296.1 hypothetical protein GA0074694_0252 [Micromonospora inyonensis]
MSPETPKPPQDAVTVRRLRVSVGAVGIALPIVLTAGYALVTGRPALLDSLSGYYHSPMRDVFVGSMCAIGVFLISYRHRRPDDLISTIAGVLAIGVALFPTAPGDPSGTERVVGVVHQVCAAVLFLLLAVFCLVLFTRTDPTVRPDPVPGNGFYRTCGYVIIAAIVLAVASNVLPDDVRDTLRPVLWCEAVAVFAFGAAWLARSDAIFRAAHPPREETPRPAEPAVS